MGLDELLQAAREDREPPDPGELSLRVVLTIVAVAAVVGFAGYQLLLLAGYHVAYPLLFAGPAAALLARRITARTHGSPVRPVRAARDVASTGGELPRDPYHGVYRWIGRLAAAERDRERFDRGVRAAVTELVDERLRLRHGVDRHRDPVRAEALVPAELWQFMTQPTRRVPKPARLLALARRIEQL